MAAMPRQAAGWLAVILSTVFISTWAVWGTVETFHEGWYYPTLLKNLALTLVQYLSPMLVFLLAALAGLYLPRAGFLVHLLLAFVAYRKFNTPAGWRLVAIPLVLLGTLYLLGRARPRAAAAALLVIPPLIIVTALGVPHGWRVAHRYDDHDLGERRIEGHGVALVWAPRGPGWPSDGASWAEAVKTCELLGADGRTLGAVPQKIWRLPTIDELVRSMVRGGRHCGGVWDPERREPSYRTTPDKESPLWDVHSKVIYWWSATEVDSDSAHRIVYNGRVLPTKKRSRWGYLAFRCVRRNPASGR